MTSSVIDQLIQASIDGRLLGQSRDWAGASFDEAQAREVAGQITARPDASSYHLLMALRRCVPERYVEISPETRASVLVDALRTTRYLNDWGNLGPGGGYDGIAAQALLEAGDAAREPLLGLLGDEAPAPLMGSESATISKQYQYRRSDYAYRYLRLLRGEEPEFDPDPAKRDAAHRRLCEQADVSADADARK